VAEHGSYRDGVLRSELGLALRIRVAPELRYLGSVAFELARLAAVERHVFALGEPDIRRMVVVQFEGFLPNVTDQYRYALRDPQVLGGDTYGRMANELSLREELAESPHAEMAHTDAFLQSKGLRLGDRQAVARYARIVGEDRRKEILIFFHEIGGSVDGVLERAANAFQLWSPGGA
jgi:hypothetical protein